MKCIKSIKKTKYYDLDEIRRTDNGDAEEKVSSGNWIFIPKSEWKLSIRKLKNEEMKEKTPTNSDSSKEVNDSTTVAEKQLKRKKKTKQ